MGNIYPCPIIQEKAGKKNSKSSLENRGRCKSPLEVVCGNGESWQSNEYSTVSAESGGLLKPVQRCHLVTVPQWSVSDFQCDGNHVLEEYLDKTLGNMCV